MGFFEREEKCDFGEVGGEMREKKKNNRETRELEKFCKMLCSCILFLVPYKMEVFLFQLII